MNYEQMVQETNDLIRRVMLRNEIEMAVLLLAGISLLIAFGLMVWKEHREKVRHLRAETDWYQQNMNPINWGGQSLGNEVDFEEDEDGRMFYRLH